MLRAIVFVIAALASTGLSAAQDVTTRAGTIEQEQAAKAKDLHPYVVTKTEEIFHQVDTIFEGGTIRWHPFFDNAYAGGGFTLGVGHVNYVSAYNYIDVRGSYSIAGYKRVEAEFGVAAGAARWLTLLDGLRRPTSGKGAA